MRALSMSVMMACSVSTLVACDTNDAGTPGYRQLHQEIFAPRCASEACHGGERGVASLRFSELEAAYERLIEGEPVNAAARNEGWKLVHSGDVEASYLYRKLAQRNVELNTDGFGAGMPMTGERLGPQSLAAVRRWIEGGAPLDGEGFEADFISEEEDSAYIRCDGSDADEMRACFEPTPEGTERLYSPPIEVPAQTELIACSYLDWRADRELLIAAARGQQMSGGHHIAVFVANSPNVDSTPRECTNEEMMNFRFIAAAGGGGGQDTVMPEATALRIREGEQIVLQSHYINTADEPMVVMDAVDLQLASQGSTETIVDPFAMVQSDFSVAPQDSHWVTKDCTIDEPMDVYMLLGHTHNFGVLFELEWLPSDGESQLLYHATDGPLLRDSPEIKMYDPPLNLQQGDMLRMTCEWNNTEDHALVWPEEMCVGLMYYGPGRGWLQCSNDEEHPSALAAGDEAGCAEPDDPGNALGVGKHCTADGGECSDNADANFCLAPFDASTNYCSMIGCSDDQECGEGARCISQTAGSACVPAKCIDD